MSPYGCDRAVCAQQAWSNQFNLTLSKEQTSIVFYSHEIILLLSNVLKEPKFHISECIKVSQSLYKKDESMKGLFNVCFTYKSLNNPSFFTDAQETDPGEV